MTRPLILVGLLSAAALTAATSDSPPVSPRADSLDLLLTVGEKIERLELRIEIDGLSAPAVWDETFARLHAFLDRNGDGVLDRAEAGRVPSAFLLRQLLWGQFITEPTGSPAFTTLDQDGDGKVRRDELADFYRRQGLGGVLVGVGKFAATDRLTEALLTHLDTNRDGKVSEAEWKAADETMRRCDRNDDELVHPGELVELSGYPAARGAHLMTAPGPESKDDRIIESLPFLVLPLRSEDEHWIGVLEARRKRQPNFPQLPEKLRDLRRSRPAAVWKARLGSRRKGEGVLEIVGGSTSDETRLIHVTSGLRLELRLDAGKLSEQFTTSRKQFAHLFAECDADRNGQFDGTELAAPRAAPLKQLVSLADRNEDGTLDGKEFKAWLDLQEQIAKGHALLSLLDFGGGLFELIDADHDGALAVRELRTAWARLKAAGCLGPDGLIRTKLPRHLLATISRGQPTSSLMRPIRRGPAWFVAMDRNQDGDVSIKEWVGAFPLFRKLDRDSDGLLSAEEAQAVSRSHGSR